MARFGEVNRRSHPCLLWGLETVKPTGMLMKVENLHVAYARPRPHGISLEVRAN
jgi:hypothetical protein